MSSCVRPKPGVWAWVRLLLPAESWSRDGHSFLSDNRFESNWISVQEILLYDGR